MHVFAIRFLYLKLYIYCYHSDSIAHAICGKNSFARQYHCIVSIYAYS